MGEILIVALGRVFDPAVLGMVVLAVPLGLAFGILPGLSGVTALAVLLPFVYGMEPLAGLAFLLAAHAVVYTGGSATAIALGIPGAPPNAATVADGHALFRRGEGHRALGAAFAASALGGLVGFAGLLLLLPVLEPLVLAIGTPETLMLALLGIACVAFVGDGPLDKGLIAAGLGALLAQVGYQGITGVPRFWLGVDKLLDGFPLVPLILGLFAVPELLALVGRAASAEAASPRNSEDSVAAGLGSLLRHRWLALRSSLIGLLVGIVPGIGGETAPFVAYAAARQRPASERPFGHGAIEGVIAPESSNNAKEGGALVPTLALGIPGSTGMAVLMGGFLILGLQPGPGFLANHMDLAVSLALVLALANLLAGGLLLLLVPRLAPLLTAVVALGAFTVANDPLDGLLVLVFGALGWVMRRFHYSRPALVLGFVLAPTIETSLHISLQAHGPSFLLRPGCMAIIGTIGLVLVWPALRRAVTRGRP